MEYVYQLADKYDAPALDAAADKFMHEVVPRGHASKKQDLQMECAWRSIADPCRRAGMQFNCFAGVLVPLPDCHRDVADCGAPQGLIRRGQPAGVAGADTCKETDCSGAHTDGGRSPGCNM